MLVCLLVNFLLGAYCVPVCCLLTGFWVFGVRSFPTLVTLVLAGAPNTPLHPFIQPWPHKAGSLARAVHKPSSPPLPSGSERNNPSSPPLPQGSKQQNKECFGFQLRSLESVADLITAWTFRAGSIWKSPKSGPLI